MGLASDPSKEDEHKDSYEPLGSCEEIWLYVAKPRFKPGGSHRPYLTVEKKILVEVTTAYIVVKNGSGATGSQGNEWRTLCRRTTVSFLDPLPESAYVLGSRA